jgi:predicted small metal-binding protein
MRSFDRSTDEKRTDSMKTHLNCPCGEVIKGENEDELVANTQEHLKQNHPGHEYSRDEILMMAW